MSAQRSWKRYPAQLICMTTWEDSAFIRAYAAIRDVSVAQILREFTEVGIGGLPDDVRRAVLQHLAGGEDDTTSGGAQTGSP